MEKTMPEWKSKTIVAIKDARRLRTVEEERRNLRLAALRDAANSVADVLAARNPALEAQTQMHLDFYTLVVGWPGADEIITLTFRLIDPPLSWIELSDYTETSRKDLEESYQEGLGADGEVIGAERPRMTVAAEDFAGVADVICPMTFCNPYMTAEEYLDNFLSSVEQIVRC